MPVEVVDVAVACGEEDNCGRITNKLLVVVFGCCCCDTEPFGNDLRMDEAFFDSRIIVVVIVAVAVVDEDRLLVWRWRCCDVIVDMRERL